VNRFQFVDDHRDFYEVKRLCEVLKINRSSYYAWKSAAPARRQRLVADAVLGAQIKTTFNAENGCYGAKRVTASINASDGNSAGGVAVQRVNHKRTARLMRQMGLFGYTKKRRVKTTVSAKRVPTFPDLLQRRFTADRPNAVYVGDITYLPIADGSNMYLATVIDCYSRQLTGFAIADHMRTELVEEALTMAQKVRGDLNGAIFHSDHGSVGGFNWSSQHLDRGGVQRWQRRTGAGRLVMFRRGCVGSGVRTGRCVRRCVLRAGRIRRVWCNVSSGTQSRRASRQRKRR